VRYFYTGPEATLGAFLYPLGAEDSLSALWITMPWDAYGTGEVVSMGPSIGHREAKKTVATLRTGRMTIITCCNRRPTARRRRIRWTEDGQTGCRSVASHDQYRPSGRLFVRFEL
jgi:hypothetical protein